MASLTRVEKLMVAGICMIVLSIVLFIGGNNWLAWNTGFMMAVFGVSALMIVAYENSRDEHKNLLMVILPIMLLSLFLAMPTASAQIPATQTLFPDSVPAQSAWLALGGGAGCVTATKWLCVDEIPHDSSTSYLRNNISPVTQYQSVGFGNFSLDTGIGLDAIDSVEIYSWIATVSDITQRIEIFVGTTSCGNITVPITGAGTWTNASIILQGCGILAWDSSTVSRLYAVYSCTDSAGGGSEICYWTSAHVIVHYRYLSQTISFWIIVGMLLWAFFLVLGLADASGIMTIISGMLGITVSFFLIPYSNVLFYIIIGVSLIMFFFGILALLGVASE